MQWTILYSLIILPPKICFIWKEKKKKKRNLTAFDVSNYCVIIKFKMAIIFNTCSLICLVILCELDGEVGTLKFPGSDYSLATLLKMCALKYWGL